MPVFSLAELKTVTGTSEPGQAIKGDLVKLGFPLTPPKKAAAFPGVGQQKGIAAPFSYQAETLPS